MGDGVGVGGRAFEIAFGMEVRRRLTFVFRGFKMAFWMG